MDTQVNFEKKGSTGYVWLETKKKYPILHKEAIKQLVVASKKAMKDKELKTIIAFSKNDSFCTGLDVKDFLLLPEKELRASIYNGVGVLDNIEKSDKIFIAAVSGYCIGGGLEVAMAYDYVIASPDAKFGLPEINLGIIPGANGIKRLVKAIGKRKAFELLVTGKLIDAKEAKRLGLVHEIVPKRKLMKRAEEFAVELNGKNPMAVKMIKNLVHKGTYQDISKEEIESFLKTRNSEFAKQIIRGFLNKNKK